MAEFAVDRCLCIYSIIFLLFRVRTRRGRLFASMLTYISIAVMAFGIILCVDYLGIGIKNALTAEFPQIAVCATRSGVFCNALVTPPKI